MYRLVDAVLKPRADDRPGLRPVDYAMARFGESTPVDNVAFNEVYDTIQPPLGGWVRRRVRMEERAEDILQQTWLNVHVNRGRFKAGSPAVPWVFAIANNLIKDDARKVNTRGRVMSDDELSDDVVDTFAMSALSALEYQRAADAAVVGIGELTDIERQSFELTQMQDLTLAEASALTGQSISALKSANNRAKTRIEARVRAALGRELP